MNNELREVAITCAVNYWNALNIATEITDEIHELRRAYINAFDAYVQASDISKDEAEIQIILAVIPRRKPLK